MKKHTITLELVRHGSLSSQILSTATRYIALCGNFAARDIDLHLDHRDFLDQMEGLGYKPDDDVVRNLLIRQATRDVSRILASIPALASGLASAENAEVVQLRLLVSAPELAALPFELAEGPPGSPSEGRPLFLDGKPRVVLTREARLGGLNHVPWPSRPRILFAYANMNPEQPVPAEAHLLALRRAIDPWIGWLEKPTDEIGAHVEVLPEASLAAIEATCRRACEDEQNPFTHVHILAHGMTAPARGSREMRSYLALCPSDGSGRPDPIDGQRLSRALRPLTKALDKLAVVTLASCDSGRPGSMIVGGANTAHELHNAGIPFVVASQFPLTYRGSVRLVEDLYDRLLRGEDPILAARDVRHSLSIVDDRNSHDWASIVFYTSLPMDIDAQVAQARFERMRLAGDVALKRLERALAGSDGHAPSNTMSGTTQPLGLENAKNALNTIENAMAELSRSVPSLVPRIRGWFGSAALRWAESCHVLPREKRPSSSRDAGNSQKPLWLSDMSESEAMRLAEREYSSVFSLERNATWALVQTLTVHWVLERVLDACAWVMAKRLCEEDLSSCDRSKKAGAHDCLAQLELLALALPHDTPAHRDEASAREAVKKHALALVEIMSAHSYEAFTLRRQMRRHGEWWNESLGGGVERSMAGIGVETDRMLADLGTPKHWYVH